MLPSTKAYVEDTWRLFLKSEMYRQIKCQSRQIFRFCTGKLILLTERRGVPKGAADVAREKHPFRICPLSTNRYLGFVVYLGFWPSLDLNPYKIIPGTWQKNTVVAVNQIIVNFPQFFIHLCDKIPKMLLLLLIIILKPYTFAKIVILKNHTTYFG